MIVGAPNVDTYALSLKSAGYSLRMESAGFAKAALTD